MLFLGHLHIEPDGLHFVVELLAHFAGTFELDHQWRHEHKDGLDMLEGHLEVEIAEPRGNRDHRSVSPVVLALLASFFPLL
jgi:hypothetical protein